MAGTCWDRTAEVQLVSHNSVLVCAAGRRCVDDDVREDVRDKTADSGAGGLLNVAVGQFVEGDGLAVPSLVGKGEAAAGST
eukprot:COSAG02_NODE_55853_length_288_cov_0.820106_1_plen_80_part_10